MPGILMFFNNVKVTSSFFPLSILLVMALLAHYVGSISGSHLPIYRDEAVYMTCGISYLRGVPPIECNLEHPPVAKYLIGILSRIDPFRLSLVLLNTGSAIVIYATCKRLGLARVAFACSALFLLDTIVFNTYRFYLLDPFSIFFVLLGVYFFLRDRLIYSAIALGLALGSKLSALPVLLGLAGFYVFKRRYKHLFVFATVVIITYTLSYSADLSTGADGIIRHHLMMYEYMSWRHRLSLPIALNGLTRLVARFEQWFYAGEIFIRMSINESSVVIVEEIIKEKGGRVLIVSVGAGSPLWYLFIPVLILNTYRVLVHRVKDELRLIVLLAWLTLVNILAGSLDWYYVNTLPFLYMNICMYLHGLRDHRVKHVLVTLVVIILQALFFTTTITGLLPFTIEYIYA